jgi:predicted metal-dependent hydrolase
MTAHPTAPAAKLDITPRHMDFDFPADTPKYWLAGDPWSTHLLNALSLTFPAGEKSFIESVRKVRDRITDPALQAEVRAFVAQEALHTKEHESFNEWLRGQGVPVDSIYHQISTHIAQHRGSLTEEQNLAVTCALEHFTAIMANAFLTSPELLDEMHENVRWLWIWHAIEETEHKAVAFDVYKAIGGRYLPRMIAMAIITVNFIRLNSRYQRELVRTDGQLGNLASLARHLWMFWGPRGHFTRIIPQYLAYFRPGFHPWQHDNRAAVARWKEAVEARAKRMGLAASSSAAPAARPTAAPQDPQPRPALRAA